MGVCDSVTKTNISYSDTLNENDESLIKRKNRRHSNISSDQIDKNIKLKRTKSIEKKYKKEINENHNLTHSPNNIRKKSKKNSIKIEKINREKRAKTLDFLDKDYEKKEKEKITVKHKSKIEEPKNENELDINTRLIINYNNKNPKDQYKIIKKLGKGASGTVWKVKNIKTGLVRAMKRITKIRNDTNKLNEILNEIEILKNLDHPNIVKIFEFFIEADGYYIITEYCEYGELFKEIKLKGFFNEKIAANIMYQVFNAINYCHSTIKLIHRDLKPENIMIESIDSENGFYNIKIIDFGTAKIKQNNKSENKVLGSCYYIAPEVLNKKYNEKCDIWSCGVILYILLCGNVPFNGRDEREITQKIKLGKYDLNKKPFDNISEEGKDLIKQCLEMNVNKRISAKKALEHPWFNLLNTKEYFIKVNEYFMMKTINNLIMYKPKNKLQQLALTYLVHNFPDLNEIKNINKIFIMFNTSGNGKLSKEETYKGLLKYLNYSSNEDLNNKVNEIFKNIDNDNNGFIECEEFSRGALDKRIFLDENVLKFTFDYMDKDGSGEISLHELKEVFGVKDDKDAEKSLKEIIDKIDKDGNGEISIKEYSDMMKNIII